MTTRTTTQPSTHTPHRALIRGIAAGATAAALIIGAAGLASATNTAPAATPSGPAQTPATAWLVASGK